MSEYVQEALFMTKEELVHKVEWEGGVMEAVEYGITVSQLPPDTPEDILDAWAQLEEAQLCVSAVYRWLEME